VLCKNWKSDHVGSVPDPLIFRLLVLVQDALVAAVANASVYVPETVITSQVMPSESVSDPDDSDIYTTLLEFIFLTYHFCMMNNRLT